jgi:serine/threonine protein phosphatase 1
MIYCIADVHGYYSLFRQAVNYLKEGDELYVLGDILDRGPHGIKILRDIMEDERITLLMGNHELIFLDAIDEEQGLDDMSLSLQTLFMNGGEQTLIEFRTFNTIEQKKMKEYLQNLKYFATIQFTTAPPNPKDKKIWLSHDNWPYPLTFNRENLFWRTEKCDLCWNRIKKDNIVWPEEINDWYQIHGHTPVGTKYFPSIEDYPVNYADGHMWNIDLATPETGLLALFNVSEMKVEKIFNDLSNNRGQRNF